MLSKVTRLLCCFVVLAGLAGTTWADVIVYDGFDYNEGSLGGQAGGTGWDDGVAWDGDQTVSSPGMEYLNLPVVGNRVTSTATASFRMMPADFDPANKTIWISFLCLNEGTPSWCGISPFMGGSEALFIGKPSDTSTWGLALYNAQSDSGGATGARNSEIPVEELAFFVVRIINGDSNARITAWLDPDLYEEPTVDTAFYDNETAGETTGRVLFDRIRIAGAGQVLYFDELRVGETYGDVAIGLNPALASEPSPAHEAVDVPRDSMLSWTAGQFAAAHDVYLGTAPDDVNDATVTNPLDVLVNQGQTGTTYDPGLLDYGQSYYWRVDEVNAAPSNAIYKGDVWSFTTEPFAYPLEGVVATSNGTSTDTQGPEKAVDGSGLDENDQHSTSSSAMWVATPAADETTYIQFEFDHVYKLHEMLVWNSNMEFEMFLGLGVKEAMIEYSQDATTWTTLGDVMLNQAPGSPGYAFNTTVPFDGISAQYVRLNVQSMWSATAQFASLAEVRFTYIPVLAREPQPADGATNVALDTMLSWRAGREAASHEVYLSTDPNAVDLAGTTTQSTYDPGVLDLDATYYWQISEVNDAEAVTAWVGDIWSFTTQEYVVIDDFESYVDDESEGGQAIWSAWIDGLVEYGGDAANGGSQVGHTTSPFAEQTIVHGGAQSMPLYFDNTSASDISEADYALDPAQDWTASGIKSLSLWFYGAEGNTGQLYVKINETQVLYDGQATDVARTTWQPWNIDLSTSGANLSNVTSVSVGIQGAGSGVLYVDDIRLYAKTAEYDVPTDPERVGLVAEYTFEGNVNDSSGHGFHGTLENDPGFVAGHNGSAIDLDGTNDYVSTGVVASDLGIAGNNPRTFSVWVYTRSFGNGAIYDIGERTTAMDFSLRTLDNTENRWRVQYWGGDYDFSFDTAGKWVHFAHVHDGQRTKIYANGLLIVDWEKTVDTSDANPFQIGCYGWREFYFNGLIDDLQVYDRALSGGEVLWLAGRTAPQSLPF